MNGLELAAHVRARADLATLPVIMITSRSMDKHRRQALAMGVDPIADDVMARKPRPRSRRKI